ncbi:MAG: lipoate--protein ligase family protein [candidate division WS1 bacterium]|nr:lipoate--protein ligase family protein [candidate division WS1 bacterium]
MTHWRLIEDGFADGFTNMAVDEAIAEAVASDRQPPTLRLYGWQPPAVSLGYHQELEDGIDRAAVADRGYDIVRRPTGGRAILHADELTYSFCIRQDAIRGGHSTMESYREISAGIITGLELLGAQVSLGPGAEMPPPLGEGLDADAARAICFAKTARCDLQAAGRKVVGSAQVRRGGGILQHGSIPITIDLEDQIAVMPGSDGRLSRQVLAGAAMSVSELLGRTVSYDELAAAVAAGFGETFGIELRREELSPAEQAEAQRLREERYATAEWNERRPVAGSG